MHFRRICLARLQVMFTPRSLVACEQAMCDVKVAAVWVHGAIFCRVVKLFRLLGQVWCVISHVALMASSGTGVCTEAVISVEALAQWTGVLGSMTQWFRLGMRLLQ